MQEVIIKVSEIDGNIFNIKVNRDNCIVISKRLELEKLKIINRLKNYKSAGLIGSIYYPRNKKMQKELDELVNKKRIITKAIDQINEIFFK